MGFRGWSADMTLSPFTAATFRMCSGVIIWAAHFALIYGFTGLACARAFADLVPWAVMGATLVALAAMALTIAPALRRGREIDGTKGYAPRSSPSLRKAPRAARHRGAIFLRALDFERTMTIGVGALAALAIVLEALPVLVVAPCG
jgi:hypothetical protein